jgi:hypothetical protein
LEAWLAKGTFNLGSVNILENVQPPPTIGGITLPPTPPTGIVTADFAGYTTAQLNPYPHNPSIGSCMAYGPIPNSSGTLPVPPTQLNAGPAINVSGPEGNASVSRLQNGTYDGGLGELSTPFIPATGGTFHIDNGSGGPDVGAFTASLTLAPLMVWSNMDAITSSGVTRANGLTVTWTGGNPGTYVSISGNSTLVGGTSAEAANFVCLAPVGDGQFTVPAAVLLSLPPSGSVARLLEVVNESNPVTLSVQGLDYGSVFGTVGYQTDVIYR